MQRMKAIATGKLFGVCDCYVLDHGIRVLSRRGFLRFLTGVPGATDFSRFLDRIPKGYIDLSLFPELAFELPNGGMGYALDVDMIVALCAAYDEADADDELHASQRHLARNARRLLRAAAKAGLTALVDEATGYDAVRRRGELAGIFREALGAWEETFSPQLVQELCRLGVAGGGNVGWRGGRYPRPLSSSFRRIYELIIGPDAAKRLKALNPAPRKGRNHHQWLTDDARDLLKKNMGIVTFCARTSSSRSEFWTRLESHYNGQRYLVFAG
jgi:hypothetical protein